MLVLALDTATEACVAAVAEVDAASPASQVRVLAVRAPVDAKRHGELLIPLVAAVLAEAGLRPADLDGVVVGLGPGPFTSLRVGIVTAASLADALGRRAVGVCTLDAIAAAVPATSAVRDLVVATDARRREVYWARYVDRVRVTGPEVSRPADLAERLDEEGGGGAPVVGSGAALYPDLGRRALVGPGDARSGGAEPVRFPDPAALVALGLPALLADAAPGPLAPLYLRRPDAVPPGAPKAADQASRAGAR